MSTNVNSYGVMAVLNPPLSKDLWEELTEKFYKDGVDVQLNYDCTLIYTIGDTSEYFCGMVFHDLDGLEDFKKNLNKYHLTIDNDTCTSYNCVWYNGADSHMSTLTLDEFNNRKENS